MTTTTERRDGLTIITVDPGETVLCDFCNADWTARPESGGFMFGGNATCPDCAVEMEPRIIAYGERRYIKARCPAGMSFANWVRKVLR